MAEYRLLHVYELTCPDKNTLIYLSLGMLRPNRWILMAYRLFFRAGLLTAPSLSRGDRNPSRMQNTISFRTLFPNIHSASPQRREWQRTSLLDFFPSCLLDRAASSWCLLYLFWVCLSCRWAFLASAGWFFLQPMWSTLQKKSSEQPGYRIRGGEGERALVCFCGILDTLSN